MSILTTIKKLIFNLICHDVIGNAIFQIFHGNIPDIRWNRRYTLPPGLAPSLYASLFWGFYESAEKRLINKYLPSHLPVIELGASLGIVSSHISAKLQPDTTYLMVELNPALIPYIEKNYQVGLKNKIGAVVINKPIAYDINSVKVYISRNTTESGVHFDMPSDDETLIMQATQLGSLHKGFLNNQKFTLVCDIEGMEIQILLKDRESLLICEHIIIELHPVKYQDKHYSVPDMIKILTNNLNFNLVASDGNVYYFNRS